MSSAVKPALETLAFSLDNAQRLVAAVMHSALL